MKENYFIHLFETPLKRYFYDVNMNEIVNIPETIYNYLKDIDLNYDNTNLVEEYVENLKMKGYLKQKRVKVTMHPKTNYSKCRVNSRINYLVLQVTQNCNLRCDYCVYSIGHNNRIHSNKKMDFTMAKKGIDFLIEHSFDSENLAIGFYGGEPLLEFELIKKCVEYSTSVTQGKRLEYIITTNGTLINDEVIDFFYENNFIVTISLDGPANIHDFSRHFPYSEQGSFDKIIENLEVIKNNYPEYYKNNLKFNTVLTMKNSILEIDEFFKNNPLTENSIVTFSINNNIYDEIDKPVNENYFIESRYLEFLTLLSKLGKIEDYKISEAMKIDFDNLITIARKLSTDTRKELPDEWHHGGPCMPAEKRLFMSVDGEFYPCEKVSETGVGNKIGDIFNGINIEQVNSMLNIGHINQEVCKNCWAYSFCNICILNSEDVDRENDSNNKTRCTLIRHGLEEDMKTLCILKELNYDLEYEST